MQSGKAQAREVAGHVAEEQKQITTSSIWKNIPDKST